MRALLISQDRTLSELLMRTQIHAPDSLVTEETIELGMERLAELSFNAIIVSDRQLAEDAILAFMERLNAAGNQHAVIWLQSNWHHAERNQAVMKECLAEGWSIVPHGLSIQQVAMRIGQLLYGTLIQENDKRNGLISFIGSTPNIGTTVAAFGTAAVLSKQADKKRVGYLCLNLKSAKIHRYIGDNEPSVTLDGLRPELRAGYLTSDRLMRQCRSRRDLPNLSFLFGNMQREQADYYSIEEIDVLLSAAKETFDYCIVDTNAYWDNAATIGALQHAGQRIMVTTPQLSHFQEDLNRWCRVLAPGFGFTPSDFDLLLTQQDTNGCYSPREIAREAQMPRIGEIKKYKELEQMLHDGRLVDLCLANSGLGADLSRLVGALLILYGEKGYSIRSDKKLKHRWSKWFQIGRRVGFAGK